MEEIIIREYREYRQTEILDLYRSVGWSGYYNQPEVLAKAFRNSLCIYAAYAEGQLAGLIRAVGDGASVVFIQDILVRPAYQRRGLGKQLLEYSFEKARELGYEAIVIFGNPENYIARGFKSGRKYNVAVAKDLYPVSLLVKELKEGALSGENWIYRESAAFENFDEAAAEEFDRSFPPMEKAYQPSQELFYIYSHGTVQG